MRRTAAILVLVAFAAGAPAALFAAEGFKVVGNPATTPDTISKRDISRIFLKQRTRWPDGQDAEPVDQARTTAVHEVFLREVLGKTPAQVESHWQAQIFSGRANLPQVFNSDADVVDFVRRNRGAVGYVSADASTDGVKVVRVTD